MATVNCLVTLKDRSKPVRLLFIFGTQMKIFLKPEPVLYSSLTATQLSDSIYMDYLISLMNVLKHQSGTVDAHL